ncbi:MucR family transcriptional regulator [Methylobacterium sp. Leaf86]|uniref:MucR family transcriptional regulator n=1 Tax=Methylobacterium sp. Leaf86 TaxID=1736242 RepID=UPI0006FFF114|nr:MucR family transcriptional regulator [Methylobacterium sp. Leaf86]KQO52339.1 MucR family transcriptional regulator [Methylobacterium sp. Leaf86]
MTDTHRDFQTSHVELTADIVAAYVSNNSVPVTALAELLSNVHAAISGLTTGESGAVAEGKIEKLTPAQIRKSITPDGLISFEDGKSYKTLKRHLTLRGLSPQAYRAKYGLPADYPMTAPNYSAQRSALARSLGLGQVRQKTAQEAEAVPAKAAVEEAVTTPEKPKRAGRPRKAAAAA